MKATLIKNHMKQNNKNQNFDDFSQKSSRLISKFVLQCFNKLSQNREINDVQIASSLLNYSFYYFNISDFIIINL
jgi:hypothetical protein